MKPLLSSLLSRLIRQGVLSVTWPDQTTSVFGSGGGPEAAIVFRTWSAVRRVGINPALGFGEAYMGGDLETKEGGVYDLLDLLMLNFQTGVTHPVLR